MRLNSLRNRCVFLLLLPLLLIACDEDPTDPKPEADDDILEKAFLHISGIAAPENTTAFYAFARVAADTTGSNTSDRSDIGLSLFNRFTHYTAPIRLYSSCTIALQLRHPDFDKPGILVCAGNVQRLSEYRAVLYIENFVAPLAAAGYVLELERINGVWTVIREKLLWIS